MYIINEVILLYAYMLEHLSRTLNRQSGIHQTIYFDDKKKKIYFIDEEKIV